MFKMGLLTSTAMTALASLLSGAPHGAYAQTGMHVASRDANARFLCTYGSFLVSASSGAGSGYAGSAWEHVAVPITGHGQTVRRIRVIETRGASTATSAFTVGIYSNGPSGFPGNAIAVGTGRIFARGTCGPVTVSIAPTKLKSGKKYWIEETTRNKVSSSSSDFYWEANPNVKRKAYVQSHSYYFSSLIHSSYSYSNTSPWTKQTMGPYFKLK